MKKKVMGMFCALFLAMLLTASPAAAADVTVTLPTFPVTLNGLTMEQSNSQYPLLVYKDITYVPMTWADTRLLGLESSWTAQDGLVIRKGSAQDKSSYTAYKASAANAQSYTASTASGKITVNGKQITNSAEEYPLLLFRDITYFPLTWRFAVNEFGWDYSFDSKSGLTVTPKRASGDSGINTKDPAVGRVARVTGSSVNLRSDAGTDAELRGQASRGDRFLVLGTKTVGEKVWYQVMPAAGGEKVWIASWYTELEAQTQANASGAVNPGNQADPNPPADSGGSLVGKTIVVTGSTVNLRSAASTSSAVLGRTVKGDTYTVLAETAVGGETWYQVKLRSGAKAWIAGWLVEAQSGSPSSTPGNSSSSSQSGSPPSDEKYDVVGKEIVILYSGVNLRTEPGTDAKVAGTAEKGGVYTVLAMQRVGGEAWYQIKLANGSKVWIASWLTDKPDGSASSSVQLTQVELRSVEEQSHKTVITIKHGQGNPYSTVRATADSLTVRLQNAYLGQNAQIDKAYSGGPLRHLAVEKSGSGTLQAVLTLEAGAYCTVKENGSNLVITVYSRNSNGVQSLAGKVIVLDPGHGGSDPGAVGRVLGVTDAQVGLSEGLKLRDLLQAQGAKVIMTRESDIYVGLYDRPAVSNRAEADLFVSIHANSSESTSPRGIRVYYYAPESNANLYAQSYVRKELATKVSNALAAATGNDSKVMTANYAVLRQNDRPCILIETGFLSNAEEEALLGDDKYLQTQAQAVCDGIVAYLTQR